MLTLTIDRRDEAPVYEQVANQIRRLIATGALPVGSPLPPVRRLAGDLGVGLNTIARAYRLLAGEGFLVTRDRAHVQVAPPAVRVDDASRDDLLEDLRTDLARLSQAGLSSEELTEIALAEIRALGSRKEERT